ncbi:hypothetical protein [Pontixanthobacter sp.]|uniref:hypothetical protein n=1 Tax=Pontixanthobacter sp. TaxID=2792078 RepID=UPI003C7DB580
MQTERSTVSSDNDAAAGAPAEANAVSTSKEQKTVSLALYDFDPDAASQDALVDGTLTRDGSCLYIDTPNDGRKLLVLPKTLSSWDGANEKLVFMEKSYPLGSSVTFAGGEARNAQLNSIAQPPKPECDRTAAWYVAGFLIPE